MAALVCPGPAGAGPALAAHPCSSAETPQIALLGTARAGVAARFRVTGTATPLVDWGDGGPSRARRLRPDGTLRHRYAKRGRYTVVASGRDGHCCDVQHTSCTTTPPTPDRLVVSVRRRAAH